MSVIKPTYYYLNTFGENCCVYEGYKHLTLPIYRLIADISALYYSSYINKHSY